MAVREDQHRGRIGHSAENFALNRKLALCFLKTDPTRRIGVKEKSAQGRLG